tara:strand:- start:407 stop:556 length:150 start_codon:yes stop_codon:yes gene_type:complete
LFFEQHGLEQLAPHGDLLDLLTLHGATCSDLLQHPLGALVWQHVMLYTA